MDREVYDAIKALAVGESLPAESGATASFPMSASPNAHESWSSISAAVEVTRMDGGFEFRGSTQGGSAPTLTLSYCDEWCASGDFCECYCDYEASAAPSYEVMGRVDQAWPD